MIAVVDAGTGNLHSVVRALEHAGTLSKRAAPAEVRVTADPAVVRGAARVVVPGQGAFGDCARALLGGGAAGLGAAVRDAIARGAPYLGICLGLQVLFDTSEEAPGCQGLGVFRGAVRKLRQPASGAAIKIPHVGWNRVALARAPDEARAAHATQRGRAVLGDHDEWYYFVHSYVVVPDDPAVVVATSEHGGPFAAACARDNVLAVQFHPEKSQRAGLDLLARWLDAPDDGRARGAP